MHEQITDLQQFINICGRIVKYEEEWANRGVDISYFPAHLALIHGDVSKALDAHRNDRKPTESISDLANVYIRIGYLVSSMGLKDEFIESLNNKLECRISNMDRYNAEEE